MKLTRLGYFRELPHGDPEGPSIHPLVNQGHYDDCDQILDYLSKGIMFMGVLMAVRDILNPGSKNPIPDFAHIRTDGVWAWSGDLSYYLRTYQVKLPDEFVAHVRERNYQVPDKALVDLKMLEL